jgi:hypothetical protein
MLSARCAAAEITWSLGDYLPVEEVAAAFKLDHAAAQTEGHRPASPIPAPSRIAGSAANFWKFLGWPAGPGAVVLHPRQAHPARPAPVLRLDNEEPVTTQTSSSSSDARNMVLRHDTDLDNNWLGLGLTLVEKTSGRAWVSQTELAYWHGYDDGESWSEGDRSRELVFRDLPAGTYYFVIDPEISAEKRSAVTDRIKSSATRRPGAISSSCWFSSRCCRCSAATGSAPSRPSAGRTPTSFPAAPNSAADDSDGIPEGTTDAARRHDPQPGCLHAVQLRTVPGLEPVLRRNADASRCARQMRRGRSTNNPGVMQRPLLVSVFIVASCGLAYELIAGALASYLLGDSVMQFSTVIGVYLFAMGIGSWLSKYVGGNLLVRFIQIELLVGLLGGLSAGCCSCCSRCTPGPSA